MTQSDTRANGALSDDQMVVDAFGAKILIIHKNENYQSRTEPRGHSRLEGEADIILLVGARNIKILKHNEPNYFHQIERN